MSLITIRYSRRSNRQRTTARTSKSFTTQDESIHRLQPLARTGIQSLCRPRQTGAAISHNKFIVLLRDGHPVAVWTGSTNITKSGLYGQSNVGHIVRDVVGAQNYLEYWLQLEQDPSYAALRQWIQNHTADPSGSPASGTITLFSPRKGL
ncbi:MAG: hypothetical protein VST67_10445 [Nitrospirota bacterium]|nr:hypothetical protein [Nitrospirota bacterium]